jgi:hypothetical protein
MTFETEQYQKEFNRILDTFTGVDGGVSFIKLRMLLERLDKENTYHGNLVLDIMSKFSKLIDLAAEKY